MIWGNLTVPTKVKATFVSQKGHVLVETEGAIQAAFYGTILAGGS